MGKDASPTHLSNHVVEACISGDSVSSIVAQDPSLAPGDAWERLYEDWKPSKSAKHEGGDGEANSGRTSKEELDRAAKCGKWGPKQPSDLFLRV